jgi:hypothetical protein
MPAIQVSRLKSDVTRLMGFYEKPLEFLHELHELFDYYTDRTYRPGQVQNVQPLLPHYKVSKPVIHQIERELAHANAAKPEAAWNLAETLWKDSFLEPRLLAIYLVSLASIDPPDRVIERISSWARPDDNRQIIHDLIVHGAGRLLRQQPENWSIMANIWFTSENPAIQGIGLQALFAIAEDENFDNFPLVFRLISPLVQKVPVNFQTDLLAVLQVLVRRSPAETAYFFKQVLTLAADPRMPRLIRHCLPLFDPETQAGLRQALKSPDEPGRYSS